MSITRRVAAVATALGSFVAFPAAAQSGNALPSREQIELPPMEAQLPSTAEVRVQQPADAQPCSFASSPLTAEITTLTFADGRGGSLPPEILQLLSGIRPKPGVQPIAQLCALRDEAASRLAAAGYIAAASIPSQEIADGQARLTVILGRLVDVRITGGSERARAAIGGRADRLKSLYPLRTDALERELLLASDVPGQQVQMVLQSAGTAPGELVGVLTLRSQPFAVTANVNNLGSRQIGRENGTLRLEGYGLTGLNDVTFVGASATADFEEQRTIQGGHYFGFDNGMTFGGSVAYAWSRPSLGALDLRSESLLAAIEARAPLARTVRARADASAGLEIVEQTSRLGGGSAAAPVTRDKLRVGFLRLQGRAQQPTVGGGEAWSMGGTLELRKGLDILDASQRGEIDADGYFPSQAQGNPTAFVVRGGVNSSIALTRRFALGSVFQGQWAPDPLLNFEEFSVGDYTIGRGYDPSVTSGDSAIAMRLEPSWVLPVQSSRLALQAYGFYDAVRIWNEDTGSTENGRNLRSAGLGLRAILPGRLVIDGGWAHPFDEPLNQPGAERASDRFLISVSVQFSPAAR